jgi:hypothetical protein
MLCWPFLGELNPIGSCRTKGKDQHHGNHAAIQHHAPA